jgi:Protein of unknown function (DUF2934)
MGKITVPTEEISEPDKQQEVAVLAYTFWQDRGCPEGTPDEDWFRAEREIARSKRLAGREVGDRDDERPIDVPILRFPVRSEVSRKVHEAALRRA